MKNESRAAAAPPARARPETGGTATPWAEVFESARSALDGYFLRLARGDRALAEDLFQEALLRGIEAFGPSRIPYHPMAWLEKTARRALLSRARKKTAGRPDREGHPADLLERAELSAPDSIIAVRWALGFLSRADRELLVRFYWLGQARQEIARARGISVRAVEARLARARRRLERLLGGPCRAGSIPKIPGQSPPRENSPPWRAPRTEPPSPIARSVSSCPGGIEPPRLEQPKAGEPGRAKPMAPGRAERPPRPTRPSLERAPPSPGHLDRIGGSRPEPRV